MALMKYTELIACIDVDGGSQTFGLRKLFSAANSTTPAPSTRTEPDTGLASDGIRSLGRAKQQSRLGAVRSWGAEVAADGRFWEAVRKSARKQSTTQGRAEQPRSSVPRQSWRFAIRSRAHLLQAVPGFPSTDDRSACPITFAIHGKASATALTTVC